VLTSAVSAPWGPSNASAGNAFAFCHYHDSVLCRLLTTADVENATQGQGVLDHQVFPMGGVQHVQAFGGLAMVMHASRFICVPT